jgi:hypothetical protein
VPSPPRNVRLSAITSNSANLQWERPRDADTVTVRGYAVNYGSHVGVSIDGEHSTEYTLKNLG